MYGVSYAEATGRSPMQDGNDSTLSNSHIAYCCIPIHTFLAYVNKTKVLVTNEGYHIFLAINVRVKWMDRQLEGNIEKYGGKGSVTARGSATVFDPCVGGVHCKRLAARFAFVLSRLSSGDIVGFIGVTARE
jgi:hypothetical protein